MGNQLSNQKGSDIYQQYNLVSREEILSLGRYDTYTDSTTGKYFLVFESNYSITNPEMAESEITSLRKLDSIRNNCCLLTNSINKMQMMCFDNYAITLGFEYYNESFETAIKKTGPKIQLNEQDIWLIINDLINFLLELNNFGLNHGDLQPKNILFNKNQVAKVICPLIYTVYSNAYMLRISNDDYRSTFSPELLENYQHRNISLNYDPIRSDIFSLGICLLSYIIKESYEIFYDFKANTINFDNIKSHLSELIKKGYSEELFYFLNLCLKESFYDRATLDILLKIINTHKQNTRSQYWQ